MIYNDFKNLISHCKPHNRFVIYNSLNSKEISDFYKKICSDKEIVIQNRLEINDGDLIYLETFGIDTQNLLEQILQSSVGNFFEVISNEILETYLFTKEGDTKDLQLEGSQLKRKGEIRHFLLKKIRENFLYSPLKLWSQKIDINLISDKLPESILLSIDKIINFRRSTFKDFSNLRINSIPKNLLKCWVVWGVPLIYELQEIETFYQGTVTQSSYSERFYIEQENIIVNLSKFTSDLESFAQFLNCDFFEIDLQTGETSFYNPETLPEWVNKFLMNSWRHGYFKYYYPELCF